MFECKLCEQPVNGFPDDTCRPCRQQRTETYRTQYRPSYDAVTESRDKSTHGGFGDNGLDRQGKVEAAERQREREERQRLLR